jgi:hypothetical protein
VASVDIPRAWRRGQEGWPSRFVLVQVPNVPLLVALAASAVGPLIHGDARAYVDAAGRVALGVFAYLELTDGVNWFRRLVGAVVLVYLVYTLGQSLR